MAKIDRMLVGESLVGDGNEVAHIDLIIGPRGTPAEAAFANALTNNKDGFTSLLAVVAPNLLTKPATVMFNKVTIKGAKQAVQMFGPAQRGVAMAVADSVEDGTIPAAEADNLFISVGVFIHWLAEDDAKIQDYNYRAVRESIQRAVSGSPTAAEVVAKKGSAAAPLRRPSKPQRRQKKWRAARFAGPAILFGAALLAAADGLASARHHAAADQVQHGGAPVAFAGPHRAARGVRSARPPRTTSSNLRGLTTRTRTQAAPNSLQQDVGDGFGKGLQQLQPCARPSGGTSRSRTTP